MQVTLLRYNNSLLHHLDLKPNTDRAQKQSVQARLLDSLYKIDEVVTRAADSSTQVEQQGNVDRKFRDTLGDVLKKAFGSR